MWFDVCLGLSGGRGKDGDKGLIEGSIVQYGAKMSETSSHHIAPFCAARGTEAPLTAPRRITIDR